MACLPPRHAILRVRSSISPKSPRTLFPRACAMSRKTVRKSAPSSCTSPMSSSRRNCAACWSRPSQVVLMDLVIVAILVVRIRRVVSRPLGEVVVRLKEISEGDGDLTVSLPEEGAREISLLAESFNTFVAKTRTVIDQVKGLNLEMASAAEQLSATTRDISKSNDAVSD